VKTMPTQFTKRVKEAIQIHVLQDRDGPVIAAPDAPAPPQGHSDFEEDSLVLYQNDTGPSWLVGRVAGVDHMSPILEVHRYGSLDLRKGKHIDICKFKPAFIDPKDGLQVYTERPLSRYRPIFDLIQFKDVMARDFYLTNANKLPSHVRALVSLQPSFTFEG
jgi:hypothetical protein